jgi:dCTP deaminase
MPKLNLGHYFLQQRSEKMSIKSDKWIRQMALEHDMISPFEPNQVKTDEQGQRMVSYGTSSYGYDIRCSKEFKLFTNINSTIVDPKNFDPNSFVEVNADYCIIPPNSFALARTVEYFKIPRHYRECHTIRARMGRLCDARV